MLKKLFIGLLVLSVLSSGLLFFVLKKNAAPEVHMNSESHEQDAEGAHDAPAPEAEDQKAEGHDSHSEEKEASHAEEGAAHADAKDHQELNSEVSDEETKKSEELSSGAESHTPKVEEADHSHKEDEPKNQETAPKEESSKEETIAEAEKQSLRLLTEPSGASVFVENEFLGNTPIDIPLQNKSLKIAIEAPGYKRFERNIPAQSRGVEKGKNLFAAVMKIHLESDKPKKKMAAPKHEVSHSEEEMREVPRSRVERNYYIQVKSLPELGATTEKEVASVSSLVREKSAFAVHACRVHLGAKGNWVRILLGPFDTKTEASRALAEAASLALDTEAPFVTGDQKCL